MSSDLPVLASSPDLIDARFLAGGGEMGALMRVHDWSVTPLGDPHTWPQCLRTALRLMLTTNHPMFIWWGPELVQFYNDAYRATMGPERHPSALGQRGRECWTEIWDIVGPQIRFVMSGKGATWHEEQLVPVTRHGRREDVWWTYGYSPIEDEAGVRGVLVVCNDVTEQHSASEKFRLVNETLEQRVMERTRELQASEERHRNLYNRTPMALHSVDPQAQLVDVNDHWLQLFGYAREEVIGRSPSDFMMEESARRYREQAFPELVASSDVIRVVEYRFVKRSGEFFDGRLSARAERDTAGCFIRSWSAIIDITAQKQAEEQLRQAQKMEAVGQLTGGLAHDFNNLLTGVLGNLELLDIHLHDDKLRRMVQAATRSAQRGARLTEHLLAFSRRQHLAPMPVDLNAAVDGMSDMLRRTLAGTVEVRTELADGLWPALVDITQIEVAVLNLAINARDAMPLGGTVVIETRNVRAAGRNRPSDLQSGDYVMLSVADTGSGMSDEVLTRAFEPFFTTKEVGKGTGLGLSQVYGLARQSGGTARIASKVGGGTTVEIYVPRAQVSGSTKPKRGAEAELAVRRRGTVLVVDDQDDVRDVAAAHLETLGYRVVQAASGRAMLELLEAGGTGAADLLLIDYAMRGMSGAELLRAARQARPDLPVVLMSGYPDADALAASFEDVVLLKKPFRMHELAGALDAASRLRRPSCGNVIPIDKRHC